MVAQQPPNLLGVGSNPTERVTFYEIYMKRFVRTKIDSRIAGVCGGLARLMDVDSTIIRLLFFAAFFTPIPIVIFYIACWLIVPQEYF